MNHRATATRDVSWKLDHPLKVVDFLKHLHDDIVSDVAEKLLIFDRNFSKLREKVVRHEDGSRSVAPLFSCLSFRDGSERLGEASEVGASGWASVSGGEVHKGSAEDEKAVQFHS